MLAAGVLSLAAVLAAQAPEWKTYSYPADGFRASFPSEPELQKRSIPTEAGSFELRSYLVQDSAAVLFVGVCDYGAQIAGKDPDSVLQSAKTGALTNSNSHLVSEKKITLGANSGIAFEAETEAMHLSMRIYLVGTTLYQSLVAVPVGKPYPDAARFFDSFELVPRETK
jgi:hypothetical protein